MSKHRSGSKKVPPDIGLHMECTEEELEPSQKDYYAKAEKEYNEVQAKLNNYIKKMKAEVIEKGENCFVLQLNAVPQNVSTSNATNGKVGRQNVSATPNFTPIVGQPILTRSTANNTGNTYLVMDPRLGLVVGQMPTVSTDQSTTTSKSVVTTRGRSVTVSQTATTPVTVTTRARSGGKKSGTIETEAPLTRTRDKSRNQSLSPQSVQAVFAPSTPPVSKTYRIKVNAKQQPPPVKPCENNAIGGLSAGSDAVLKPSSDDSSKGNAADSREVTFNKLSGKTFPSLVVVARPHLRLKHIHQSNITQERTALDARVKGVLMYTPTKFTEWLIQQGLIRSEQFCQTHVNNDLSPVSLKLGMYSDVSKFPYSGGYVWISECCPSQFVSVFSGSIFEGAPHPPTTLLKLIYHWACQTNVQNVVQWVKVDNLYVKNFFTNMRAVCTQAIHQKYQKIGGPKKRVEVGVISLGTTSQDGNMRQVKVEVLAVMDPESKQIRLRAVEPLSEERHFRKRFIKILEPLEEWVHKESEILTDFTVDKGTLHCMGFHTVYQVSITDPPSKYSNQNVMEYLRRIVPRMFQNTLSLLSRQIIQQFLDELVWREMWGPIASQAFNNIIAHLAEQTKLDVVDNLLTRLNKVSSNPFKNWNYSVWKPITASLSNTKAQQAPAVPPPAPAATTATATVTNLETIPLAVRLQSEIGQSPTELSEGDSPAKNIRTRKRTAEQGNLFEFTPPLPVKKVPKILQRAQVKKDEKRKSAEKSLEPAEKMPEELIKYINETVNQIPIESYYYGTRQSDEEVHEYEGRFAVKCCVCYKTFTDNIVLMRHMILHCQTDPQLIVDLKKVCQCNYCFLGFNNNNALKTHLEEVHFVVHNKVEHDFDCQICEEKFGDRVNLVYHMQKTHVEMELPYECGVCKFRTSFYKQLIDHFSQSHKGSQYIFCPFCLKVVTVAHNGETIVPNTIFYISHLERHQRKSLAKKCHRCQLSFIHKGILEQHLEADHCGFKFDYGVKPIEISDESVSMPEPNSAVIKLSPPPSIKLMKSRLKNPFVTNKFKVLEIYGVEDNMECVECEGSITRREHFAGIMNCTKCRYTTCCEIAMVEHVTIFHDSLSSQFTMGKPIILPQEMFCICGYSSSSGNRLAKHIAICDKKSAYPSEEAALAALQLRQTEKDKLREKQEQAGEGQNVLSMLGLFKKSPERKEVEDIEIEEIKIVDKESCYTEITLDDEEKLDQNVEQKSKDGEEEKESESKVSEEEKESGGKESAMEVDSNTEAEVDKGDTEMEVENVEEVKKPEEEQKADGKSENDVGEKMETEECRPEEEAMEVDEELTGGDKESSVVAEEKVEDESKSEELRSDEPNTIEDKAGEEKPESIEDDNKDQRNEEIKETVADKEEKDEILNTADNNDTEKSEEASDKVLEKEEESMVASSSDDKEEERSEEVDAAVTEETGRGKEVAEESKETIPSPISAENEPQENEEESNTELKQAEEVSDCQKKTQELANEEKEHSKPEEDVMDTKDVEKDKTLQGGEAVADEKKEEDHEVAEEAVEAAEAQDIEEAISQNEINEASESKIDEKSSNLVETENQDVETNLDNLRNEEIESQESTIDENLINENIENDQIQEAARISDVNEEVRDVSDSIAQDIPASTEMDADVPNVASILAPDVVGPNNENVTVSEVLDQEEKALVKLPTMKIDSNLPKRKRISQDEEDKSKLRYLSRSKPIGKKSVKKKFENDLKEEVLNAVSENIEVVLSQVNFENCMTADVNAKKFKKPFVKFALETIFEETLEEALEEQIELEKSEIEEQKISIENIDGDLSEDDDFISPFTEEELISLVMPFVSDNKSSLRATSELNDIPDIKPFENLPFSCSFYEKGSFYEKCEFQSILPFQSPHRELQSCPIATTGRGQENFMCLVNKPNFPVFEVESNVELESKPSSTNISIAGISSEVSVQSIVPVPSMKLVDYIALKRSLSNHEDLDKNVVPTSNIQTDVRSTFRSLYHLICRFLESPHLIYIVVFIGSTYITLNCVFHDSFHGSELVWNVFPTPFSSAAY